MSQFFVPIGAQALRLPINDAIITASYKNPKYYQQFKFNHYGVDLISHSKTRPLYACGNGEVIAAGLDGKAGEKSGLGKVIVIVYKDVYIHQTKKIQDVTCRMYHLDKWYVKAGDKVTPDTLIGEYGNTGANSTGAHLHIEFDSDTKYPLYAYGVNDANSLIIKRGPVDSTINPSHIWFVKASAPDKQSISAYSNSWYTPEDVQIPFYEEIVFENKEESIEDKVQLQIIEMQETIQELSKKCEETEKNLVEVIVQLDKNHNLVNQILSFFKNLDI